MKWNKKKTKRITRGRKKKKLEKRRKGKRKRRKKKRSRKSITSGRKCLLLKKLEINKMMMPNMKTNFNILSITSR